MSLNCQCVKDITIPDGKAVRDGTIFTKTWEVRNTGNTAWEPNTISVVVTHDPERLAINKTTVQRNLGRVPNNGLAKISVKLKAPVWEGSHTCWFRLAYFRPDLFRVGRLDLPSYVDASCFGKKFYVSFRTYGDTDRKTDKDIVNLGKMLLRSEYFGMTQDFNVYYEKGPTGPDSEGGRHPGVDFRALTPLSAYSPVNGKVVAINEEYGMVGIQVQDTDYCFFLAHLSKYIEKGRNVTVGMEVGTTGCVKTNAPHLHVELRRASRAMSYYFPDDNNNDNDTGTNIHPKRLLTDMMFKQAIGASCHRL